MQATYDLEHNLSRCDADRLRADLVVHAWDLDQLAAHHRFVTGLGDRRGTST
jgi:hypothetical protein